MEQTNRSKDGVPIWNGEASSFQTYEEMALQWEQGIPWHKRYLCGPRLVSELTGTARRHILGKRPDWVSFQGGVQHLMTHLRNALGRPQISDMTDHLNKYFKATKRRRLETMNEYITRKTEAYGRAKQAYGRVEEEHHGRSQRHEGQRRQTPSQSRWDWQSQRSGRDLPSQEGEAQSVDRQTQEEEEQWYDALHEDDENWDYNWWGSQASSRGRSQWGHQEEEAWAVETQELLPDFVQGWYLLQDATLGSNEKNVVMTALQGNYQLNRVAQELRNQWPEEELRKYDQGSKQQGLWHDNADDKDDDEIEELYYNHEDLVSSGMNAEGLALMGDAEEEAEKAFSLINQGKRTLKEARFRQHQIKMSRQYYRSSSGKGYSSKGKGKGNNLTCLRCGGGHRTSDCPDKQGPKPQANHAEEAPFVCFADGTGEKAYYQGDPGEGLLTTSEAIQKGYGILDGGATKTLGSVYALERLMELNQSKHGHDGIQGVDPDNTPTFGFGNSSRDTCLSTAQLSISAGQKPGVLQVHTLDKGTGPILVSIATLRQLGAMIDFEADLAVFRKLDPKKVVPLRQSASGHQMLSLTDDLFKEAKDCQTAVPSLSDYI